MAAKPPVEVVRYAVIDSVYMLPIEDAAEVMKLLSKATKVATNYKSAGKGFKPIDAYNEHVEMMMLTVAQHAAVYLEDPQS